MSIGWSWKSDRLFLQVDTAQTLPAAVALLLRPSGSPGMIFYRPDPRLTYVAPVPADPWRFRQGLHRPVVLSSSFCRQKVMTVISLITKTRAAQNSDRVVGLRISSSASFCCASNFDILLSYFVGDDCVKWKHNCALSAYVMSETDTWTQIKYSLHSHLGARGGVVVKALRHKQAGRGFDSRCYWNFSVT